MGWLDSLKALVNSVDTEYDRRIRAASNVKQYMVGGHGAHAAGQHDNPAEAERQGGEGGAVGNLQVEAGPHLSDGH